MPGAETESCTPLSYICKYCSDRTMFPFCLCMFLGTCFSVFPFCVYHLYPLQFCFQSLRRDHFYLEMNNPKIHFCSLFAWRKGCANSPCFPGAFWQSMLKFLLSSSWEVVLGHTWPMQKGPNPTKIARTYWILQSLGHQRMKLQQIS